VKRFCTRFGLGDAHQQLRADVQACGFCRRPDPGHSFTRVVTEGTSADCCAPSPSPLGFRTTERKLGSRPPGLPRGIRLPELSSVRSGSRTTTSGQLRVAPGPAPGSGAYSVRFAEAEGTALEPQSGRSGSVGERSGVGPGRVTTRSGDPRYALARPERVRRLCCSAQRRSCRAPASPPARAGHTQDRGVAPKEDEAQPEDGRSDDVFDGRERTPSSTIPTRSRRSSRRATIRSYPRSTWPSSGLPSRPSGSDVRCGCIRTSCGSSPYRRCWCEVITSPSARSKSPRRRPN